MSYEKPSSSAGLVSAGVLSLFVAYLLRWMVPVVDESDVAAVIVAAVIVAAIGVICLVVGLWRFFSAVDAALLHHWQSVNDAKNTAAKNDEIVKVIDVRRSRIQEDTQGGEGRVVVAP